MKTLLSLIAGLMISTGSLFAQTSIRMTVSEETKPCRRMMEQTCFQVKKEGVTEWELFYDRIQGFNFEEGYRYEIIIIETPRPEPVPQDLSRNTYKLDKIISKTKVSAKGTAADPGVIKPVLKVVSLKGMQLNTDNIYFDFNADSTQLSGKSGCNSFSIPVTFNKKRTKIKTGTAISTMMACPEEQMKQEKTFLGLLNNSKFKLAKKDGQWSWKKKRKVMFVTGTFTPEPVKTASAALPWDYLDSKILKIAQINGKPVNNSKAQLVFNAGKKRFSGNSGCNEISGAFVSTDNNLQFTHVMSTKMACADETVQQTEMTIQEILNMQKLTATFADDQLIVFDASGVKVMMLLVDGKM